jgi:hypothetical protein
MAQADVMLAPHGRAASLTAAALLVAGFVIMLGSLTVGREALEVARPVTIVSEARKRAEDPPEKFRPSRNASGPQVLIGDGVAAQNGDAVALQAVLVCLGVWSEKQEKPRECPPLEQLKRYEFWEKLPGEPRRRLTLDQLYTRSELILLNPPCQIEGVATSVCAHFGITPPRPTMSPEELCIEANMGGPCKPPPFRPAAPTNTKAPD